MRQIFNMLVDLAAEHQKELQPSVEARNQAIQKIQESYVCLDQALSNPKSVEGHRVAEAMSVADFPLYFGNAISRSFYADYPTKQGSWKDYCFMDETPSFLDVERYRIDEFGLLRKRAEQGQAKEEVLAETRIVYHPDEYAKAFSLSWRDIVNDDLGKIRQFPSKLLRAALRFEDSFVSALYDNSTSQAALVSLGANYAGTLTIGVNGVKSAYEAFMKRTDSKGNPLNVAPRYLVTHPVHELTCREILNGIDPTLTSPAVTRVTKNLLEWRGDPYIGTNTDWYLFADPADIPAVSVARMRGWETPQVYLKTPNMVPFSGGALGSPSWLLGSFEDGTIEFQVLDLIGGWADATYVGVTDYQGIFYAHA